MALAPEGQKAAAIADRMRARAQAAEARGDAERANAERAAESRQREYAEKQGVMKVPPEPPPGEPKAGAPEAPPPPVSEPLPPELGSPPPPEEPAVPPPVEAPTERLLRAIYKGEPRSVQEILQAAREPEIQEGLRRRTKSQILQEILNERKAALRVQEGKPPVSRKGRQATDTDTGEGWVDTGETPQARTERVARLEQQLAERESYAPAVEDVVEGKRPFFVQEMDASPRSLETIAKENLMGHYLGEKQPIEVLFNPQLTTPEEIRLLDRKGELATLIEPDTHWPGPGAGREPPATPSAGVPSQVSTPKSREGERGSWSGKPLPPRRPTTFTNPKLESMHPATRAEPGLWETIKQRALHYKGEVFGFEESINPRHFRDDPWLGGAKNLPLFKTLIEDMENSRYVLSNVQHKAGKIMQRMYEGILAETGQNKEDAFEIVRRVIPTLDEISNGKRDLSTTIALDEMHAEVARLLKDAPAGVHKYIDTYNQEMREMVQEAVQRGWLHPQAEQADVYWARYQDAFTDYILNSFSLPKGISELSNRNWQRARAGAPYEPITRQDFIRGPLLRRTAHEMAKWAEDFTKKTYRQFDVLSRMSTAERAAAFEGQTDLPGIREGLIGRLGGKLSLKGPDGKARRYTVVTPESYAKYRIPPGSTEEAAITRIRADQEMARDGHLYVIPERVATRFETLFHAGDQSQISRDVSVAMRNWKRMAIWAPGLQLAKRNIAGDAYWFFTEAGYHPNMELLKASNQLAQWAASGGRAATPDVLRIYYGDVKPTEGRLYEIQQAYKRQGVGASGFMGDPRGHYEISAVEHLAGDPNAPLIQKGAGEFAYRTKHLMDALDHASQLREAFLRTVMFKGLMEGAAKGKAITSHTFDVEGLGPEYAAGRIAKGFAGNYTRISPYFQTSFRDKFAPFLTWPTSMLSNEWHWNKSILTKTLGGDAVAASEWLIKRGIPLYLINEQRKKWPEYWNLMQKGGAWFTQLGMSFPLASKDEDGNRHVVVPSVGTDVALQLLNVNNLYDHLKDVVDGKMTKEDYAQSILMDLGKGMGRSLAGVTGPMADIVLGLYSNTDPRTGRRIAGSPENPGYEYTWGGHLEKTSWAVRQLIPIINQLEVGLKKSAKNPKLKAVGTLPRIGEALMTGPLSPDPTSAFLYTYDEAGLPEAALLEQERQVEVLHATAMQNIQDAMVELMTTHDRSKLQQVIQGLREGKARGQYPPSDERVEAMLNSPKTMQKVIEARNKAAGTKGGRETTRQLLRKLREAGLEAGVESAETRAPSETAEALKRIQRGSPSGTRFLQKYREEKHAP